MFALLYAGAMIVLAFYGVNLLWMAVVVARGGKSDADPPPDPNRNGSLPRVTIQIPLYNEAGVARRVIDACAAIQYPRDRFQLQILDDSSDETVAISRQAVDDWKEKGLNISHIQRSHREGYKAGALGNGLKSADGDLIAIFDADFVPPENFLLSLVPFMEEEKLGMIQARWGHINAHSSLLTQVQAWSLDTHFAVEHVARSASGCFINFNGTAGLWKRSCITESGGWHGDTLAEDLDLSYRAQLRGWKFKYLHELEAPAELPETLGALRVQQSRWTKGTAETARKLLRPLWRASFPLKTKVQGTIHLTAHLVYPCLLLAALLHPLLLFQQASGFGPGETYFGIMGLGLVGLLGFFLAQMFAQRQLYPDWWRRMRFFPIFMAGSMGLAISNTKAVWDAWRQFRTPFERTPKANGRYRVRRSKSIVALEAAMAVYSAAGLVFLLWEGLWAASGFQMIFSMSYIFITRYNILELRSQTL
ncbi:MAG: glycosyltransferase [Rhodothermaceae bacterium]|nr:glycosyltransferase [Rhodothermaceae bacterium]MYG70161.1 glycosyltransferase [Rhodothermaceae bacterium]MYJ44970.1 glycosyltransferase [Rhodothermaceae bacterium]